MNDQTKKLLIIGGVVVGAAFMVHQFGGQLGKAVGATSQVRVGVHNFLVVGLMALAFIVLAKVAANRFPVPGLTDVVNAA